MIARQVLRYGVVGLVSNAILSAAYIFLTAVGVEPKLAMTLVFVIGTVQTFFVNRAWTFRSSAPTSAFFKYALVYGAGYAINWLGLWIFVDRLGSPHQIVQLIMIFIVAAFIFVNLRYWVFARRDGRDVSKSPFENSINR